MERKTVLFAPLNWGLGHTTRSIPIIYSYLNDSNYRVILVADGEAYDFLKMEFPNVEIFRIKDVHVSYLKGMWLPFGILFTGCKMMQVNAKEHKILQELVKTEKVDLIISDNRYGIWHKHVKSVLITHQLVVLPPKIFAFVKPILKWFLRQKLSNFSEIWVPDIEEFPGLAGKLSHAKKMHPNIKYIGPQSRYSKIEVIAKRPLVAVISGPLPFRQQLAERLVDISFRANAPMELYCNNIEISNPSEKIKIIQNAPFLVLNEALNSAEIVIASGGYSTLMDMMVLEKNAILIPTPHQSEQNYLAKLHHEKIQFVYFEDLSIDVLGN